jgi:hypothetical protein
VYANTVAQNFLIESCWDNDAFSVKIIPAEKKNDGLCIFFEQKTDSILSA